MNTTIWKFELKSGSRQEVFMPAGAEVMSVGIQRGVYSLWAMVDPTAEQVPRSIEIFGTGFNVPQGTMVKRRFIGTVQDGTFVWHFFERLK